MNLKFYYDNDNKYLKLIEIIFFNKKKKFEKKRKTKTIFIAIIYIPY